MERMCFARADAIVINTPEATRKYRELYPAHAGKMRTIPNGFDGEELAHAAADLERPFPWRDPGDGAFVISHTGTFFRHGNGDRIPHVLLSAFKQLLEDGVVSAGDFRIILAGDPPPGLRERVSHLGLDGLVETPGIIPHFDAARLIFRSDLLLLFDSRGDGESYVRSKLYDYLGSGKPILGIAPEGASRELLKRSGRGLLADPDDPKEVRQALEAMISGRDTPARDPNFGDPNFDLASYERGRIAEKLASLLDAVTG